MSGRLRAGDGGLMIELSGEQVRTIAEHAGSYARAELVDLTSLRGALVEQASGEISYALVRGLLVLVAFPADGTPRRLSEVADELGMKTSTVHRCLATLVVAGLLERDGETRRYFRLGRFSV